MYSEKRINVPSFIKHGDLEISCKCRHSPELSRAHLLEVIPARPGKKILDPSCQWKWARTASLAGAREEFPALGITEDEEIK